MMQSILSNNKGMLLMAFVAAIIGLLWSFQVQAGGPFSRSGAVVTAIGLVLLSSDKIVGQDLRIPIRMADSPFNSIDPAHYQFINEKVPE